MRDVLQIARCGPGRAVPEVIDDTAVIGLEQALKYQTGEKLVLRRFPGAVFVAADGQ